jgi:anthranilate synthase component 1
MKIDDLHIVGASPEILVRLQNEEVTVRPIAGTVKRGKDNKEDKELAHKLKSDPKEIAEHLMLIDLGRNDVGRIAEVGSVKTTEEMKIEKYSHVMHLVSNVVGKIKKGLTSIDVLKATFPAGTLSGAPKIRAMEIIDELEPDRRGVYGGAVGYLSWTGNMDVAIAIRTAVIQGKNLSVRAGGGIVYDSDPESEYQESLNKAMSIMKAVEEMD